MRTGSRYPRRLGAALALLLGGLCFINALPMAAAAGAQGADELAARIEAFVREHGVPADAKVELPPLHDFALGLESVSPIEVRLSTRAQAPRAGMLPVTVSLLDAGQEVKRAVVTARIQSTQSVLVTARRLPRGAIVQPSDLRESVLDEADVPSHALPRREQLLGLRTVRALRAGLVWRPEWVERAPLVRRGEAVRVVIDSGALRVELRGTAREDGYVGDPLRVLNPQSRREIVGRVGTDGVVHVAR